MAKNVTAQRLGGGAEEGPERSVSEVEKGAEMARGAFRARIENRDCRDDLLQERPTRSANIASPFVMANATKAEL